MKPFLVLLLPFVLLGCGPEPDAPTEEALSAALPEPVADAPNASPTTQADAIAAIKKLGGTVNLDKTSGEVVGVDLNYTQITDAGLVHLKGLTSLTTLGLSETQITDAGLAEIKAALPNCDILR